MNDDNGAPVAGFAIDYESKWFKAASDLSVARYEIDELTRELEDAPPQIVVDELRAENSELRAALQTATDAHAAAVAENGRLKTLFQLALINAPYDEPKTIANPKLLLAQAWAFWELRQRILLALEAAATPRDRDGGTA